MGLANFFHEEVLPHYVIPHHGEKVDHDQEQNSCENESVIVQKDGFCDVAKCVIKIGDINQQDRVEEEYFPEVGKVGGDQVEGKEPEIAAFDDEFDLVNQIVQTWESHVEVVDARMDLQELGSLA